LGGLFARKTDASPYRLRREIELLYLTEGKEVVKGEKCTVDSLLFGGEGGLGKHLKVEKVVSFPVERSA